MSGDGGGRERRQSIRRVPGRFAVHRLPADAAPPTMELSSGALVSITRTAEELSVVAPEDVEVPGARTQPGWAAFRVDGPLDFSWTGIVASLSSALARAGIPVFVISTFDTDWLLVPFEQASSAAAAWRSDGHEVA